MDRTPLAILLGLCGFLGYFGLHNSDSLRLRLDEMERASLLETREKADLHRELDRLETELELASVQWDEQAAREASAARIAEQLELTNSRIEKLGQAVDVHGLRLDSVALNQESYNPSTIESSLNARDQEIAKRMEEMVGMASSAAELANASQRQIEALGAEFGRTEDREKMWKSLLGPIVQLSGEESVGSGVILRGPASEGSDEVADYILTAWHVIRDIQGSLYNRDMPVPVTIYLSETETRDETATLLEFDPVLDVAILRLDGDRPSENIALLTDQAGLSGVRIFDSIYAVGCPLGNDPIPTLGQISALDHDVDGESYLMINAPTYVGNSGGGIFTAERHELLGIFSKVYTHGSLRPTIVTHMGLVTPMHVIYSWFEEVGFGYLIPKETIDLASASSVREASIAAPVSGE